MTAGAVAESVPFSAGGPLSPPECTGSFEAVPSPDVGEGPNQLTGVSAVSTTDAWAVGFHNSFGDSGNTLVEHWDGTRWSVVPSPTPGRGSRLFGVHAVSSNDVWAVGHTSVTEDTIRMLTLHWDGSAWEVEPTPRFGPGSGLAAVTAISSMDVWAVGSYADQDGDTRALAVHWDGTAWAVVPTPRLRTTFSSFSGVSATATDDVWAVGSQLKDQERTLVEHWDGISWKVVKSRSMPGGSSLTGVAAVSPSDVWAVGPSYSDNRPLIEHWNGTEWMLVPSVEGLDDHDLWAVTGFSATDAWAVGHFVDFDFQDSFALSLRWNGRQWEYGGAESPGVESNILFGVSGTSPDDIWAVGHHDTGQNPALTLIEHYCPTA
jgi:hypothetical protein